MENAVMMSPHSVDTTHVSATPETKVTPRRKGKKFDIVNFLLPSLSAFTVYRVWQIQ